MQDKKQLFCFTYAGGNKSFFDEIERDLDGIDVIKLEYAGHGERHKESFYRDFDELADDMFREVKDRASSKFALFGYSIGSITAVEVLRRIMSSGMKKPSHIFFCLFYTSDAAPQHIRGGILRTSHFVLRQYIVCITNNNVQ